LRISFVITNAPPLVGGLEKVCLRVAQNLQKLGHDVTIFGRFTQGRHQMEDFFSVSEKNQNLECEGVNVRVLTLDAKARLLLNPVFKLIWRKSTFPLARWLYVAAMRGQIAASSRGADVVHFFGNGPEMLGFAAEAAARKVGAKFVVEPALHEGQWGDKWFDALLYKRAHLLLAHTRYEAGVLERMGMPATKIRTIVHGVDFCDSGDGGRFRKKHGIAGPMVLFLGRKTQEKGVGRLLEAWPMVVEKFPEATLVFAGPKNAEFDKLKNCLTTNHANRREKGNGDLTTEDTENTEGEAGLRPGSRACAAFSNPSTSELARDCENTSLTHSASSPAFALRADEDWRSEIEDKREENTDRLGVKTFESAALANTAHSRSEWSGVFEEPSSSLLGSGNAKTPPDRAPGVPELASSFRVVGEFRVQKSAALGAGCSALESARVLNLDDLAEGEKQDALAACDLLCVPSEGESFGMVYFEAWAYKKPVVALDLPVLRETIGGGGAGILVKNDFREVAAGIMRLLENSSLRKEMGERGVDVAQNHSWDEAVKSYELVYRTLKK
jgi:glycosyltransferase involved in cell wall biosynthesis